MPRRGSAGRGRTVACRSTIWPCCVGQFSNRTRTSCARYIACSARAAQKPRCPQDRTIRCASASARIADRLNRSQPTPSSKASSRARPRRMNYSRARRGSSAQQRADRVSHDVSVSPMNGRRPRALYKDLSVQTLLAMLLGVLVGYLWPQSANALRPLGELFIRLVRMIVAPIIFCTVVHGIASVGEARRVGRVAIKTLIYFEVVTLFALVLGLVIV